MSESVRIGPYDYSLIPLPDGSEDYGEFDSQSQTISLRNRFASKQQWADTLLHEIIHGVWEVQGLDAADGEERIVQGTSTGLIGVMRDNQKLFTEILKALK